MSAHIPNKALEKILQKIDATALPENVTVYFVLGMPMSDIGKGTFVAHLLSLLQNADAIKFDGLLNTNANGRHTAPGHDDFGIYEKYNPDRTFGDERYILGGHLFREFIDLYGEYENLCFRPHFYSYFISKIQEIWHSIGSPEHYIIEIGGTIIDYEVDIYIPPTISYFKKKLGNRCKIVLMTELGWNGTYVKTRSLQRAVEEFGKRFMTPDIILAREPQHMPALSKDERVAHEVIVSEQVASRIGIQIPPRNIICVPFYDRERIDELGSYYRERLEDFLTDKREIFIGSTNDGKISDWKRYLNGDYIVTSPADAGISIDVEEGDTSLRENAERKAILWAKASGKVTISEDTGFFIHALNNEPGVSIKRWGGKFSKELTNTEFMQHLAESLRGQTDLTAHFETVYAVATPDGRVFSIPFVNEGHIDTSLFGEAADKGFPLSAVFKANGRSKTWAQMTPGERIAWDMPIVAEVKRIVSMLEPG